MTQSLEHNWIDCQVSLPPPKMDVFVQYKPLGASKPIVDCAGRFKMFDDQDLLCWFNSRGQVMRGIVSHWMEIPPIDARAAKVRSLKKLTSSLTLVETFEIGSDEGIREFTFSDEAENLWYAEALTEDMARIKAAGEIMQSGIGQSGGDKTSVANDPEALQRPSNQNLLEHLTRVQASNHRVGKVLSELKQSGVLPEKWLQRFEEAMSLDTPA